MSVLGKLMFWKRKDDFSDLGLGKDPMARAMPGMPSMKDDFGMDNFNQSMDPMAGSGFGQNNQNPLGQNNLGQNNLGQNFGMGQNQGLGQNGASQGPSDFRGFGNGFSSTNFGNQYNPARDLENKNFEIISSKLDALRASIDSLNQRLANIEAIARGEEEQHKRGRYY